MLSGSVVVRDGVITTSDMMTHTVTPMEERSTSFMPSVELPGELSSIWFVVVRGRADSRYRYGVPMGSSHPRLTINITSFSACVELFSWHVGSGVRRL
ncbi:hypothetical protein LSAT2_022041 [Lamellibrachia satsuma]|nr:hypothetical protein LSAT2_022041 [Lamellibrachia satsuma]